ncbi:MAG: DUF58 domain-containing protein [Pirellulaceae bacterium]
MTDWIISALQDHGAFLFRIAGLLMLVLLAPLLALAWFKRVFPHTPIVIAVALPAVLSLGLLIDQRMLPFIVVADVIIPLIALVDLFTLAGPKSFQVEREALRVASIRGNHKVTLHISNLRRLSRTAWVRDDVPQEFSVEPKQFVLRLGPRSRTTVHYDLKASRRGKFSLPKVHIRVRSFLGFWQRFLEYPVENPIHVYPDMKQLAEFAILARTNRLSLMGVRRTRKVGTENEFERLRDYTLDDNYKYMDWRATARRSKLTVKDFQTSHSQRLIFLLDCGRLMTNEASGLSLLDHSLNAALMLSYVALRQGDSVGMVCFSDRILSYVPPKGGMTQMNQLLHASFDRFPDIVESRYDDAFMHLATHCKKRSLVVLITNIIDEVNSHQVESYLGTLVGKHLPLGVLLRDHQLFSAADAPHTGDISLFRSAAAAEILSWRHQVLRDLEHKGVLALDVFPEDMTAPLVNSYLQIKARHLL